MAVKGTYAVVPFPPVWAERVWGKLMRLLRPWFYFAHVTTRPLYDDPIPQPPEGIVIRYPTREELHEVAASADMGLERQRVDSALARGDICSAAYQADRMVGYTWNAYRTAPHLDGIWIEFQPPYRYGYKSLVIPEYRGRRISNAMSTHSDRKSIERGFTHAISFVETHNYKSIRASCRQPGRKFEGVAGYFSLFGRCIPFRSRAVKRLGFRFVPPQNTTLHRDRILLSGGKT